MKLTAENRELRTFEMPRRPDQNKAAIQKDIDRLDLLINRAEQNTRRDPGLNREIIAKLTFVKMKFTEESLQNQGQTKAVAKKAS